MRVQSCVLLLTLVALPSATGAAPKTRVPALLERARYVALGYDVGDGFVSVKPDPDAVGRFRQASGGKPAIAGAKACYAASVDEARIVVYEAVGGRPGIRLWSAAEAGGLAGSPPRLYKSFRDEIEAAAKKP